MKEGAVSLWIRPLFQSSMRNGLFVFLIAICAGSLALPQSTTTPKPKASSPASTSSKKAVTKKASTKTGASKKSTKTSGKTAAAWHPRQVTPTPERYKEIQQALADKGYLKSEPNGVWDAQSIDALRQFQTDQKLSVTGRISSASLIGLGLGPNNSKGETPAVPVPISPAAPAPAPPTTPEQ
jgi:Putative peptidoglycan binding domain